MKTALRYDPFHPPLYDFHLGRAYGLCGDHENTLPRLRACLDRTPDLWPGLTYLSVALAHLGRMEEAYWAFGQSCGFQAIDSIEQYAWTGA